MSAELHDKAKCLDCDWQRSSISQVDVETHATTRGHTVTTTSWSRLLPAVLKRLGGAR